MPWVFLGKSPLVTGKCIISSHTDPACDQMHKAQLCQELAQSDPCCWYPQHSRTREVRTNQQAQARVVIAKEGGKSGKQKGGFLRSSRPGIKLGRTSHSACMCLVQTESLHRTRCMYKTREKTWKNRLQITKRKLPKLKETLHKPKIPLLSKAALLQCRRTRNSLSPLHCHSCQWHRKGSLAKAANCAVSPPHLLRPPRLHS